MNEYENDDAVSAESANVHDDDEIPSANQIEARIMNAAQVIALVCYEGGRGVGGEEDKHAKHS